MPSILGRQHGFFGEQFALGEMLPADVEVAAFAGEEEHTFDATAGRWVSVRRPDIAGLLRHLARKPRFFAIAFKDDGQVSVSRTGRLAGFLRRITRSIRLEAERAIESALSELKAELAALSCLGPRAAHTCELILKFRAELVSSIPEVRLRTKSIVDDIGKLVGQAVRYWIPELPALTLRHVLAAGGRTAIYIPRD